jgi:hypothetical protein
MFRLGSTVKAFTFFNFLFGLIICPDEVVLFILTPAVDHTVFSHSERGVLASIYLFDIIF